ncbi:uncharacterized protein LOC100844592 [Brachypodium distachyon]|uniref:DUF7794 domain-containing protein n=1 Tax=Brachypodium distachyon TaxID=15368 RepID=I1I067_BRADI|nr:uncharacterized protein LOC100844592 [Brachypodium distachyon]PNT66473.1 hypothetical protein BRADI_3g12820v3 [Brachypodium distachyon]|eukprot:XP_010234217.1 uncharacterized protein LOC100844592 [Brachypodium distachyon]
MARRHLLLPLLALAFSVSLAAPQGLGDVAAFIDGASHRYLRHQQHDQQASSMSLDEVSAAVSVLLGFAPPASLPALSSSKLNKVLLPNPFDRPRAVFLMQLDGSHASVDSFISEAGTIFRTRIDGAKNLATGLTDKDELIVIHSDESLAVQDNDLTNLANWLEGSYQKADGKLKIPLESGNSLTLFISKEADLEFASSLISLLKTIKRSIQVHEDFSGGIVSPAELLVCHFTGIKALEDEYGSAEIVKQGAEVVRTALSKAFDLLQGAYRGKIVGLVISAKEASTSLASIIDAPSSMHISRRLEEASRTNAAASIAAIYLVRLSLAWITGIILLVSTLIGVCLLMNMPLTRDTLLYSNVKID